MKKLKGVSHMGWMGCSRAGNLWKVGGELKKETGHKVEMKAPFPFWPARMDGC